MRRALHSLSPSVSICAIQRETLTCTPCRRRRSTANGTLITYSLPRSRISLPVVQRCARVLEVSSVVALTPPSLPSSTCLCASERARPWPNRISTVSSYDAELIPHALAGPACNATRSGRWRWQGQRRGLQHGNERGSEAEDASFKCSGLLGAEKADGPKLSSLPGGGIASHPAGEKDHPSLRR